MTVRAVVVAYGLAAFSALVAYIAFGHWKKEFERNAVIVATMAGKDTNIAHLSDTVIARNARVAELENQAPRVVERWRAVRPETTYVPAAPDTVDLTDTTAVRQALEAHRSREDSLGAVIDRLSAAGDSLARHDSTLAAASALFRRGADSLVAAQAERIRVTDILVRRLSPRWFDRIILAVGADPFDRRAHLIVGVSLVHP